MDHNLEEFDYQARRYVYDVTMNRGFPPTLAETATNLAASVEQVQASFQRLAAGRVLDYSRIPARSSWLIRSLPFRPLFWSSLTRSPVTGTAFGMRSAFRRCSTKPRAFGPLAVTVGQAWKCMLSTIRCNTSMMSFTLLFLPAIGGTILSSPEKPCFSSGRKSTLTDGANNGGSNAALCYLSSRDGA
jgi:hypothetical protein